MASKPTTNETVGGWSPGMFAVALLSKIGAPVTVENAAAIYSWEKQEGGNWNNTRERNPLNTTYGCGGSIKFPTLNCGGAQGDIASYSTWEDGLTATANTLMESRYQGIRDALARGNDGPGVVAAINSSPWTTRGAQYDSSFGETDFTESMKAVKAGGLDLGQVDPQGITGGIATGIAKKALGWTDTLGKLLAFLIDPHWWLRVGEFTGGAIAVFIGMFLVFRRELPSLPSLPIPGV